MSPTLTATLEAPEVRLPPPSIAPVLALNPPLNSTSPVTALSTYAFVAASCALVGSVTLINLLELRLTFPSAAPHWLRCMSCTLILALPLALSS